MVIVFSGKRERVKVPEGVKCVNLGFPRLNFSELRKCRHDKVMLLGTAGALKESFRAGDVILVSRVFDVRGRSYIMKPYPEEFEECLRSRGLTIHVDVSLVSVDKPAGVEEKRTLGRLGDAVDMEAFAVAAVVGPIWVVKVVSDEVDEDPFAAWSGRLHFLKRVMETVAAVAGEVLR